MKALSKPEIALFSGSKGSEFAGFEKQRKTAYIVSRAVWKFPNYPAAVLNFRERNAMKTADKIEFRGEKP